jgi:hypothetical protein
MERRTALLLATPALAVGLAIAPAAAALAATTGASATATAKGSNEVGKVGDPKQQRSRCSPSTPPPTSSATP